MMRRLLLLSSLLCCGDGCAPCHCCTPACPRSWSDPPTLECCSPVPECRPQAPPQALLLGGASSGRRVRPLLGLNAGNFQGAWGTHAALSMVADRYRQLGVTQLRTHDYSEALDIAHIYPDLSRDPLAEGSMNFTLADEVAMGGRVIQTPLSTFYVENHALMKYTQHAPFYMENH
jgi:hypothetical protein